MPAINVEEVEGDPIFALMGRYKADSFAKKCDLGVGAYRTDAGQPFVLPVVRKVDVLLASDPQVNHEYLPIGGNKDFTHAAARLIVGDSIDLAKVASVQTLSGTGANHMAAQFLSMFGAFGLHNKTIWVSDPTWGNHHGIFAHEGLTIKKYPYWDAEKRALKFDGLISALQSAQKGDIVLLHAAAHNPTGVDPTQEQWKKICQVVKDRQLFVLFDSAYQGFASGDLDKDAWSVRYFISQKVPLAICQSFAKNMGLYGERTGALHIVDPGASAGEVKAIVSQLEKLNRAEFSTPPAYGARIAAKILTTPELYSEWKANIKEMADRIISMRASLKDAIIKLGTAGTWDHITSQIGMFSFTGLTAPQCKRLVDEFHVYLVSNGRISMAGVNTSNVDYIAKSIDAVVKGDKANL